MQPDVSIYKSNPYQFDYHWIMYGFSFINLRRSISISVCCFIGCNVTDGAVLWRPFLHSQPGNNGDEIQLCVDGCHVDSSPAAKRLCLHWKQMDWMRSWHLVGLSHRNRKVQPDNCSSLLPSESAIKTGKQRLWRMNNTCKYEQNALAVDMLSTLVVVTSWLSSFVNSLCCSEDQVWSLRWSRMP